MPDPVVAPCPHCGRLPTIARPYGPEHYRWAHCCPVLHAMLQDGHAYRTYQAAVAGWQDSCAARAARAPMPQDAE